MEFRIADTFTDSLSRLTAQEQKAVKTTAFDLQLNPAAPGLRFHRMYRAKDPNFWSLRVNLEYPWEKWAVFLHPDQRALVERRFAGPARVSGSAGTGKTIVALHRAVHLARRAPDAKVLLTTFSTTLANALKAKLGHLAGNEPAVAGRITIEAIHDLALRLYTERFGKPSIPADDAIAATIADAAGKAGVRQFNHRFLVNEWTDVVDAWNLQSWQEYRDVARLGRKTRIGGKQREQLWAIFDAARAAFTAQGQVTWPVIFARLSTELGSGSIRSFDFIVADEAQDLGVAEMRFLAALTGGRPDALFLAGDLGQRIFQTPFSWKALGIDVRGRSHTLRINYRTSHQIRSQADRLLPHSLGDVDGLVESRRGTVSVFNGPPPEVKIARSEDEERRDVAAWIVDRLREGYLPQEIGVFVRSDAQMGRARKALVEAKTAYVALCEDVSTAAGKVSISTMHLAKGLEFRGVVVMACDDEVLPLQERIESVTDESDLEEVYNTERHLLYVACTRARDRLLITAVAPGSEFLGDLHMTDSQNMGVPRKSRIEPTKASKGMP